MPGFPLVDWTWTVPRGSLTPLNVSTNVTVPPTTLTSLDDTCAVMVMTVPLDGVSGVTNRDVVVALDAHAAGTAVTNARALNNSGINRLKDACREIRRRLTATWVECVIGSDLRSERSIE